MAGRFALLTDEHVPGPILKGLIRPGWDVERAVDVFGQRTDDDVLFAYAAKEGRVLVTTDEPAEAIAKQWLTDGKTFQRSRVEGLFYCAECRVEGPDSRHAVPGRAAGP